MPDTIQRAQRRKETLFSLRVPAVPGRFLLATPFAWPLDEVFPFDMAIRTRTIERINGWGIRTWRWGIGSASEHWPQYRAAIGSAIKACEAHNVRAEFAIGSENVTACWPRWDQAGGLTKRPDFDSACRAIELALQGVAAVNEGP